MICRSCGLDVPHTSYPTLRGYIDRPEPHNARCGRRCVGGGITTADRHPGELTLGPAILRAHRRSGCDDCGRADSREPAWQWKAKGEA